MFHALYITSAHPKRPDAAYIMTPKYKSSNAGAQLLRIVRNNHGPSLCPGSGPLGMLPNATGATELGNTPYRPYVF
jgi:hypothetical protein